MYYETKMFAFLRYLELNIKLNGSIFPLQIPLQQQRSHRADNPGHQGWQQGCHQQHQVRYQGRARLQQYRGVHAGKTMLLF